MIEIRGIYKSFGRKEVLKDLNATIKEGEIFTIIGPSGQRKSTLLRLINLLDEPTANLDPVATEAIEELILRYNREQGITVIMSTHDMLQGQRLAHRIGVMMHGTFSQTGTPRDVFSTPKNKEVARFIGIGNVLEGSISATEKGIATISVGKTVIHAVTDLPLGVRACGCIRPEDIALHLSHAKRISALNVLEGTISKIIAAGPVNEILVDCGISLMATLTWKSVEDLDLHEGDVVRISF